MPIFRLLEEIVFPPPGLAEPDGLLAVGGDLSAERLVAAYRMGIFPWYEEGSPILWWSPDPRLVLVPGRMKVSRSLGKTIRRGTFRVTADRAFGRVVALCARVHRERDGATWLTSEMQDAYIALHRRGLAHSVESWRGGVLAGGLYGVALGGAFFGESMFSLEADASKTALAALSGLLEGWGFLLIDCQVTTGHLRGLGAEEMPRDGFMALLGRALALRGGPRRWVLGGREKQGQEKL